MFQPSDLLLYLVFAAGTAMSLFAFFWGRRLKTGPLSARLDWEPELTALLERGCAVSGEVELEAPSVKVLADTLVVQLQNPFHAQQSPWVVSLAKRGELFVTRVGEGAVSFTGKDLAVGEGFISAQAGEPGRVRVRYAVEVPGARKFVTLGQLWALGLGLPASIIAPAMIFLHIAGSSDPAVRGQTAQVLQAFQVVWEPYLLVGLGAQRIKMAGRYLEILIAAAAYELRTGRPAVPGSVVPPPDEPTR
jgi:hypothetical protein